jgi:hypothetical protein
MNLSQKLYSQGWIPGIPSYDNTSWEGFQIEYFRGVMWHRKQS